MSKIVLSYRRSDSTAIAGRVVDRLASRFGDDSVFMDIDSIPFGVDYRENIRGQLRESSVLILLIGPGWLGPRADGKDRIQSEADPIRTEVETALNDHVPIIPVLVDDAAMPTANELPDALKPLAFLNAAPLDTGRDFRYHMDRLIRRIEEVLGDEGQSARGTGKQALAGGWTVPRRWGLLAVPAILIVVAGAALVFAPQSWFHWLTAPREAQAPQFPKFDARLTDQTGYLGIPTRQRASERLAKLQSETGVQAVIAVLQEPSPPWPGGLAEGLAQHWEVGGVEKKGILLVIVPSQLKVDLYVGSGVSRLQDAAVQEQIVKNVRRELHASREDVTGGIMGAVADMEEILLKDPGEWLRRTSGLPQHRPKVEPAVMPPTTYRVRMGISKGEQNVRDGPGTQDRRVLFSIPEGSTGVTLSSCRVSEDGTKPWCYAHWQGKSGWISTCCLVNEATGEALRVECISPDAPCEIVTQP